MNNNPHIVIIGNGISGTTAAREIRKRSDYRITLVSNETPYFFSRPALMYVYMGQMKLEHTQPYENHFWKKNKIELLFDEVIQVNTSEKKLTLKNSTLHFDILIIACGSKPAFYHWKGQHLNGIQGFYSVHDLKKLEENTQKSKNAILIGGGLIASEMAEMLYSRNINTTLLVREKNYWQENLPPQEAKMVEKEITRHGIAIRFETQVEEFLGENGKIIAVKTNRNEIIPCDFAGVCTGVTPNIEFLKTSAIEVDKGILVNEFLETNCSDIYAIGDCAQQKSPLPFRKSIEQVWYTGKIMGETVAKTICEEKTMYRPGIWFNSAKFFDLEYQVYGQAGNFQKNEYDSFYWENTAQQKALRIAYHKQSNAMVGIHSLGIRLKQNICEEWIRNKVSIKQVIEQLHKANFNPEFYTKYEKEISRLFANSTHHSA